MSTDSLTQSLNIPTSVQTRTLKLSTVRTVLAKYTFTNPDHIPQGLPRRKVSDQKAKDIEGYNAVLAQSKGMGHLAAVGRVRPGHSDTGVKTIDNLQFVQFGSLRRGLANSGFVLRAIDIFRKGSEYKWVVTLVFEKGQFYEETAETTAEEKVAHALLNSNQVTEAIRALARTTWQYCHVWDNSDLKDIATINIGGRLPGIKALHEVGVHDGQVVPVPLYFVRQKNKTAAAKTGS